MIGQIVGPRGVRGELKVRVESDDPTRFLHLREVLLGEGLRPFRVQAARLHKNMALLTLESVVDREAAEAWRGAYVYVHIDNALPLSEDEYYFHQLEGLAVATCEGEPLGHVQEVLTTGANDVYVVRGEGGEILLPAIKETILRIDLDKGVMIVRVPDGLR